MDKPNTTEMMLMLVRVVAKCPECGGEMVSDVVQTLHFYTDQPVGRKFTHTCQACQHTQSYGKSYPYEEKRSIPFAPCASDIPAETGT